MPSYVRVRISIATELPPLCFTIGDLLGKRAHIRRFTTSDNQKIMNGISHFNNWADNIFEKIDTLITVCVVPRLGAERSCVALERGTPSGVLMRWSICGWYWCIHDARIYRFIAVETRKKKLSKTRFSMY